MISSCIFCSMVEACNVPAPFSDSFAIPRTESRTNSTPTVAEGNPMVVSSVLPLEQEARHRNCTSQVWSDLQREKKVDGTITATCNHYKRNFNGRSVKGTIRVL